MSDSAVTLPSGRPHTLILGKSRLGGYPEYGLGLEVSEYNSGSGSFEGGVRVEVWVV